mgnify:CR=1
MIKEHIIKIDEEKFIPYTFIDISSISLRDMKCKKRDIEKKLIEIENL